jgi:hypothetical protein
MALETKPRSDVKAEIEQNIAVGRPGGQAIAAGSYLPDAAMLFSTRTGGDSASSSRTRGITSRP